jgi:selenophosphate synthase
MISGLLASQFELWSSLINDSVVSKAHFAIPLVNLEYGLTSLATANFMRASDVLTVGGTMISSPTFQSIGVVTAFLSPVCNAL